MIHSNNEGNELSSTTRYTQLTAGELSILDDHYLRALEFGHDPDLAEAFNEVQQEIALRRAPIPGVTSYRFTPIPELTDDNAAVVEACWDEYLSMWVDTLRTTPAAAWEIAETFKNMGRQEEFLAAALQRLAR